MFTGIIRHFGTITNRTEQADGSIVLEITAPFSQDLHEGDSVSVNGVCLTVLSHINTSWTCRLMSETINKTTLALLQIGSQVNLELPTKAGDRLDGHIVQGHVDEICRIIDISARGDDRVFTLQPSAEFISRITPKGSVTLDGVSLTVVDVTNAAFTVSIMPYTLEHTMFGSRKIGDAVNMETDHTRQSTWLFGIVIQGDKRGTALGFPTANIELDADSQRPPEGIYACRAMVENDPTIYAGALHVGPRPTFEGASASVELHIINFVSKDLYGLTIRFTVVEKIRDIEKFESPKTLAAAISQDVAKATAILMYH